jgi:hypothetical protein
LWRSSSSRWRVGSLLLSHSSSFLFLLFSSLFSNLSFVSFRSSDLSESEDYISCQFIGEKHEMRMKEREKEKRREMLCIDKDDELNLISFMLKLFEHLKNLNFHSRF